MKPSTSVCVGNEDCWREILGYLEVDFDQDSASEIADKRKTMYGVALLSPAITDYALDSLWKSMTTLEPVLRVLNPAPGATDSFNIPLQPRIFFQQNSVKNPWENSWVLDEPTRNDVERIAFYLRRVRNIHIKGIQWKESMLWGVLRGMLTFLDSGPIASFLQLKSLSIDLSSFKPNYSWAQLVDPIILPSLENISIHAPEIDEPRSLEHIFLTLKWCCKKLTTITYRGKGFDFIVDKCSRFPSLRILKVSFEDHVTRSDHRFFSFSHSVDDAPFLTELECDLRLFGGHTQKSSFLIPVSNNLKILHLIGNFVDIYKLFRFGHPFHYRTLPTLRSIHSLTLSIGVLSDDDTFCNSLCSMVATVFPGLHSLSIRRTNASVRNLIQFYSPPILHQQDIEKLFPNGSLTSFVLENIPHSLSEKSIVTMAKSWPQLQILKIYNPVNSLTRVYAPNILIELSHHLPSLKLLGLPLKLTPFSEPPLHDHQSSSNLRQLLITCPCNNENEDHGMAVAINLMILFPKLASIELSDDHVPPGMRSGNLTTRSYYKNLQKLIDFHHRAWGIRLSYHQRVQKKEAPW